MHDVCVPKFSWFWFDLLNIDIYAPEIWGIDTQNDGVSKVIPILNTAMLRIHSWPRWWVPPTKMPYRQIQGLGKDFQIRLKVEVAIVVVTVAVDPDILLQSRPLHLTAQDAFEKGHDPEDCQKGEKKCSPFS